MNTRTLILKTARHHWRGHVGTVLGTLVSTAVLVGALLVGDSVKYSLHRFALMRLGDTAFAMDARHRFFQADLAAALHDDLAARVAPLLRLRGVAIGAPGPDGQPLQANGVQVLGVDERFWGLASGYRCELSDDTAAVSARLAQRLSLKVGDSLSLRVGKPALMPRDAPLASRKEALSARGLFTVGAIVPDDALGRFGLAVNQIPPNNVFVSLSWLQRRLNLTDRANTLLVAQPAGPQGGGRAELSLPDLTAALARVWRIDFAGLSLREVPEAGIVQLESDRVFLDPRVAQAALRPAGAVGALSYLANSISRGDGDARRAVPYSFVTALSPSTDAQLSLVPPDMRDDEIILNRWLADRLGASPGDRVRLAYYELGSGEGFVEKTRDFTVRSLVGMEALTRERALAPAFPGLTDVDRCADWDIGMPMDAGLLKDKANEAYWQQYRQTPKAFVTFAAGRAMWANRFGDCTAVRYPLAAGNLAALRTALDRSIDPASLGFFFTPVRAEALRAAEQAIDFGGLFLGMSVFLIAAGLMLTGLLFVFGVQRRSAEIGTLLAVGYTRRRVSLMLLAEGAVVAAVGVGAGALPALGYTGLLIGALARYWQAAVAGSVIVFHVRLASMVMGLAIAWLCALVSMAVGLRRMTRRPVCELLRPAAAAEAPGARRVTRGPRLVLIGSLVLLAAAGALVAAIGRNAANAVDVFFGAGTLLLVGALGLCRTVFHALRGGAAPRLTLARLAVRNAARRPARSLTVVSLLACGCFMVLAVSSMQEDVSAGAQRRDSGTGGFALFGEATLPVLDDLASGRGRAANRFDEDPVLHDVRAVSLRVYDGDDASCFNLNRARAPRLLGVPVQAFVDRGAFAERGAAAGLWDKLEQPLADGAVPGLAGDADTAEWGLGGQNGGKDAERKALTYRDEHGALFKVQIVGSLPMRLSVFQGTVLISESAFARRFPSEDGYRMFLFDAPPDAVRAVREALSRRFDTAGMDVTLCVERLAAFYSVESTYLRMFLVLGGLGLLLGTAGMAAVVLRNVVERRGELALLRAVGFAPARVRRVLVIEHSLLLGMGLACGVIAAVISMWPNLHAPGVKIPFGLAAALVAGIAAGGLLWTCVAARWSTRGDLIPALRSE